MPSTKTQAKLAKAAPGAAPARRPRQRKPAAAHAAAAASAAALQRRDEPSIEPSIEPSPEPQQAPKPEPVAQVLRKFRLVFNAVKTHFQQVEKRAGIGGAQLWALSVVQAQPGIGVNDLARAMDIHQTTTSNLVKALVAGGLLIAEKNGPDRRAVQLRVLPAGTRVLRKAPGPFSGVLPDALARLSPTTLRRLDRDLQDLLKELHTDERAAGVPLAQM